MEKRSAAVADGDPKRRSTGAASGDYGVSLRQVDR
jgi:hypothetical protein